MKTKTHRRFGRKIVDAKQPLTVIVTPADIKGAVCRDHQRCVIARTLKRKTGAPWVDVGTSTVLVAEGKHIARRYKLPKLAKAQVAWFDTHAGAFAPCKVGLAPPPPSLRLGDRTGVRARSGPHHHNYPVHRRKPTR